MEKARLQILQDINNVLSSLNIKDLKRILLYALSLRSV